MSASTSDIRRSLRISRSPATADDARSAGDRRVLELVELRPAGRAGRGSARSTRMEGAASAPARSIRRTKTAWSPTMKVGTPHTCWPLGDGLVGRLDGVDRRSPLAISSNTTSASTSCASSTARTCASSRSWPPWSWRSANSASCTSRNRSANLSRTTTPAWSARSPESSCQWPQMSGSPSATCTCPSENGTKVTSQGAPPGGPPPRGCGRCARTGSGSPR